MCAHKVRSELRKMRRSFLLFVLVCFQSAAAREACLLISRATWDSLTDRPAHGLSWLPTKQKSKRREPAPDRKRSRRMESFVVTHEKPTIVDIAASSSLQRNDESIAVSELGAFKPWPAIRVIESRIGGTAQLIAIHCARRTPKSGEFKFLITEIAGWVRCCEQTVRRMMPEIINAGLLTRKRTRDGYVYTWSRDAYGGADVGARRENILFQASHLHGGWDSVSEATVEQMLVEAYSEKWNSKYASPSARGLPSSKGKAAISPNASRIIVSDLIFAAQKHRDLRDKPVEALRETIRLTLMAYFENPGYDGKWLVNNQHPLDAMSRDMALLMSRLFKLKVYREAPAEVEARVPQVDRAAAAIHEHSCLCGEQATRVWFAPENSAGRQNVYTCSKKECSPARIKQEATNETRLGSTNDRAMDVQEVHLGGDTNAAPVAKPMGQGLDVSRPRFDPAKMPAVRRNPATNKPVLTATPEASRVKLIFEKYPSLRAVPCHVVQGLLDVVPEERLTKMAPHAAAEFSRQTLSEQQLAAKLFKFCIELSDAA